MQPLITTLVLVHRENDVLLGMKKRGFGEGRWNGFGGKVHEDETIEQAAYRECQEEAGITCKNLQHRGVLTFNFDDDTPTIEVHLYTTTDFEGAPQETEEMMPQWFTKDEIPFDSMWPDDRHWFPYFWEGKYFDGAFWFKDADTLIRHEITEW